MMKDNFKKNEKYYKMEKYFSNMEGNFENSEKYYKMEKYF